MTGTEIGIMLANKEFYPVLVENVPSRKRLVVTTVNDNQSNIQINLYRKNEALSDKPEYLDTLLIEDIALQKKGVPSIVLVIGIDEEKNLFAKATDKDTGNSQSLKVSLANAGTIISEESFELPDFDVTSFPETDIDDDPLRDNVLISDSEAEGTLPPGLYTAEADVDYTAKHNGRALILIILLVILLLFVMAAFVLKPSFIANIFNNSSTGGTAVAEEPAEMTEPEPEPANAAKPEPEEIVFVEVPEEPAPEPVKAPEPEKAPETVAEKPAVIPVKPAPAKESKSIRYKIKWGDTLWDICDTYYKNPWRYKYLARWNGIKNPDRIISGRYIEIPPQ